MRLCCFAFAATLCLSASSSQIPLYRPSSPTTQSRTLVDALGDDPDYSSLLFLLQRTRLIPTLNRLNGSTLFAPTNDAIKRHAKANPLWQSALDVQDNLLPDNVNEKLRQQLFYHLSNSTITTGPDGGDDGILVIDTLHFPRAPQPPSKDPPPSPPWLPLPGGTLGGKPQRLRVASNDEGTLARAGVDAFGKGGAKIVKGRVDAGNGVLLGISDVLEPPPDLATVISNQTPLSYFSKVLTSETTVLLNSTPALTIFMAVDNAWESLDKYERLYLESGFATDDLNRIVKMHAVSDNHVVWSDKLTEATKLTTIDGTELDIIVEPENKTTKVSTAKILQKDIYASNGVLHVVDSLLIPEGALRMTPEKYLLGLNCTYFVTSLHSSNLTSLINDTDAKYTILAPRDDVYSIFDDGALPEEGSDELRRMLSYHFIPGRWGPKKLADGMLLPTVLHEQGMNDTAQVMKVAVDYSASLTKPHITFGGATIVDDPVEVNNTIIYFISRPVKPPVDPVKAALPNLDLSAFLAALLSTPAGEKLKKTPSTSLLLPYNSAFERLGTLVSRYLTADSSVEDLEKVLLHHTIDSIEYSKALVNGSSLSYKTLEGSDLHVERTSNGSVSVQSSGGWTGMRAQLYPKDTLTKTGVIHELSDILLPRSVNLTIGKLMKVADANTMANLVTKAGMDWLLSGQPPPSGSRWDEAGLSGAGWTLLCPTDDAFKKLNLTELYADEERLQMIVDQHLIPVPGSSGKDLVFDDPVSNNQPLPMKDATYSTLRSPSSAYGDIVFRPDKSGGYVVGIKGARGSEGEDDSAKVVSWGRSTTGAGTGGVIQIEGMLIPYQPPWWREYGAPSGVGFFGLAGICYFLYAVNVFWRKDTTEATYEPVGGFDHEDDEA